MQSSNLYIHFPFCPSKCLYCHFNSLPITKPPDFETFLIKEWKLRSDVSRFTFKTIYLGGGSPAWLPSESWFEILPVFKMEPEAEVTLEVNPDLAKQLDWAILQSLGINRAVLGVQAWNDNELRMLGRNTTTVQIHSAWEDLNLRGPSNLGIDLLYAIPGQSLAGWIRSLQTTLSLRPKHISLYELDLNGRNWSVQQPSQSSCIKMYKLAHDVLTKAGYIHYEISNFALPGYSAKHNLAVWQGENYMGLGPGAHGRINRRRYANASFPDCWKTMLEQSSLPEASFWLMSEAEHAIWDAIIGLRTAKGIDVSLWRIVAIKEFDDDLRLAGLLEGEERIHLTLNGWLVSNRIFLELTNNKGV